MRQDNDGCTALHHADEANQPMMFKLLVEEGEAVIPCFYMLNALVNDFVLAGHGNMQH